MYSSEDAIREVSETTGVEYSDEQLAVLQHQGGMCIMACAGSGKTTVLTHLIAKRCLTGEITDTKYLLCTTYSNAGKKELQSRLVKLLASLGLATDVVIKTIHATYLEVLKHFGVKIGTICTEGKKAQLISEVLKELGIMLEEDEKETLSSLLSYQVNNLMSDTDLVQSSAYTLENFPITKYTAVRQKYVQKKMQEKLTDFDDLQMMMYSLMVHNPNQQVIDYCHDKYRYIYLDEFQDTSKIQFAILRKMVSNPDNLVVIGDDDQSIYAWRGADPSIILNVCGYFPIKKFVLSTNYRCCGEIVKLAAEGIKCNKERVDKDMKPFKEGGELKICPTGGSLLDISQKAFVHIKKLIESGVEPENIAVLCRNNRQTSILSSMLLDNQMYYKASSETMKFTKLPLFKDILAILSLVDTDYDANSAKQILWKLVQFLGTRGTSVITKLMTDSSITLKDALWHILMNYTQYAGYTEKRHSGTVKISPVVEAKISSMATSYLYKVEVQASLRELYYTMCIKNDTERAKALLELYRTGCSFMYKSPDKARLLDGVIDYCHYKLKTKTPDECYQSFKKAEVYDTADNLYDDVVELTTIHGAKGREWDYVIILADDNVSFPNLDGINTMLDRGVTKENVIKWIEEERRLHYVAFTRARKQLALFSYPNMLSIYTLECLGMKSDNELIYSCGLMGEIPQDVVEYARGQVQKYEYDLSEDTKKLLYS